MQRYRENTNNILMIFSDIQQTRDIIPKEVMYNASQRKNIAICKYIEVIKDMQNGGLNK